MFQGSIIQAACVFLALSGCILPVHAASSTECETWPDWNNFRHHFVSDDGRVVDRSFPQQITTSEGQSYALMFALIANDRAAFEQILRWTENNLAAGDLTARLPAWQWGQREDGDWAVIDSNAASDADLWIAYALNEAGRLWQNPRFTNLAEQLAARILREETADIPGLGLTLLPGPMGFHTDEKTWRLNPSYSPLQIFRRFSDAFAQPEWNRLARTSIRLITDSAPLGYAPEWVDYKIGKGFLPVQDPVAVGVGFNAIRVYLWAGMLDRQDPASAILLNRLAPLGHQVAKNGVWTLELQGPNGVIKHTVSPGFSSALLPFLKTTRLHRSLREQHERVTSLSPQDRTDNYYDQVLTLFGLGWYDSRYRFDRMGRLIPRWKCSNS